MIDRRHLVLVGGAGALAASRFSRGQTRAPMRRIGVLLTSSETLAAPLVAALERGMQELGWTDGKDIEYRFAYAHGFIDRFAALVAELMAQRVDLIVVSSVAGAVAAQAASKTTPIVMASAAAVVGTGIVNSLARPGGNVTGLTAQFEDVLPKVVEIMHEIVPAARRVAMLLNDTTPTLAPLWAVARSACATLGLEAVRVSTGSPTGFTGVGEQITASRCQAVVVSTDSMFWTARAQLQEAMATTRLPVGYGFREHALQGGLFSYGVNLPDSFHQAARFVDKILKGAKPADLPMEQPTTFELVINLKTAKALGLTIPQSVLLRADDVVR